ncbi:unnamed protein product [Ectocarpus sp. 13 AM-2016]
MSGMLESSSDDGCMSDHSFDFVEVEGGTTYSSDGDATVTSSLAPPKGWSTLSLSDAEAVKTGPAAVTTATTTGAAGGRREFISAPIAAASFCQTAAAVTKSSTRFEPSSPAAFSCRACGNLLRDCVECPTCHSLFCRDHLAVDKQNGTSPCPCEPCSPAPIATTLSAASTSSPAAARVHHPCEAFLPNIPVQRMADAVPSRCDGCGISLSWGELGRHACDQQLVPCGRRQHGCSWFGKRHEREAHEASSTCPGRLALAQAEALEARSEAARLRAAGEEAERRASSAEMRASELEARLAAAERCLQERDQEAASLRGKITTMTAAAAVTAEENGKKQERLMQQLKQQAAAAAVAQDARRAGKQQQQQQQQQQVAATRTSQPPQQHQQQQPPTTMPFAAILNRAGFSPQTATPAAAAAEPVRLPLAVPDKKKSGAGSRAAATATTQTVVPGTASRASGRGTAKGTLSAAVKTARAGGSPPRASAGVMMDTASQAPVPAVEACLKPYLDRPSSLLEKKVVVFWPRQGRWYTGRPTVYKEATREHRVEYDDGDVRDHVLAHRSWGLLG